MTKTISRTLLLVALLLAGMVFAFSATPALAADVYVDTVEDYSPGPTKGGGAIAPGRDVPANATGMEDGDFVSLGFGGSIELSFPSLFGGTLDLTVFERTNGSYPLEKADVYVSEDGSDWTMVGTARNDTTSSNDPRPNVFELDENMCVKYVRVVDSTDQDLHSSNSADGFDLDAVGADETQECIKRGGGDVRVKNSNKAKVKNDIEAKANTGKNDAGGAQGGNGGNSGSVTNSGDDAEGNTTGAGGNGGNANGLGSGGYVTTGNATANAGAVNVVNRNLTRVSADCGCEGDVKVKNKNRAKVRNYVDAKANTGKNWAGGAKGGNGGTSGGVDNSNGEEDADAKNNTTGKGGNGGASSEGGWVETGNARADAFAENVVNRNKTRVRR